MLTWHLDLTVSLRPSQRWPGLFAYETILMTVVGQG